MHTRDRPPGSAIRASLADEVCIRDAQMHDDDELLLLWRELMELHVDLDPRFALSEEADSRFFSYLDTARSRDDYQVRVATLGHRVVGFAIACVLPNSPLYRAHWIGYINDLCVTRSVRRRGIGDRLVADSVRWLLSCGVESVEVYVAHHNTTARQFWRRVGGQEYLERLSLDLSRFGFRSNMR